MTKKRRPWPEKRRKRQAEINKTTRPWESSTGPTSAEGKAICAANALKSGFYTADMRELRALLRTHAAMLKTLSSSLHGSSVQSIFPTKNMDHTHKACDDNRGKNDSSLPPTPQQVR